MRFRFLTVLAVWLGGVVAYVALSVLVSRVFVFGMTAWGHRPDSTRMEYVWFVLLRRPILEMCLFWGVLYASALARPDCFGRSGRVWKHLGLSYALSLLGSVLLIRTLYLPLPDFESNFALSASVFCGIALAVLCFVLALLMWVRVAFGTKRDIGSEPAQELPTKG